MKVKFQLHQSPESIKSLISIQVKERLSKTTYNDNLEKNIEKFIKTNINRYYWFIDYIITHNQLFHRKNNDWCPVSVKSLSRKSLFSNTKWKLGKKLIYLIKEDLINAGLIECNNNFSKKMAVSMKYRIINAEAIKIYNIEEGVKAINNQIQKEYKKNLNEYLTTDNIMIKHNLRFMQQLDFSSVDVSNLDEYEIMQISKFQEENFKINNTETGRTYTNFTNLKKTVRSWVEIDGEKINGVDIVNSQPLFLSQLIKQKINQPTESTKAFIKYIELGKIYELFFKLLNDDARAVKDIIIEGDERKSMKSKLYSYIYNDNDYYSTDLQNIIEDNFRQVAEFINKHKGSHLAKMMQKEEASVINSVYKNVINKGIIAGTLLDGIYTKESSIEVVMEEFQKVFKNKGIKGKLAYTNEYNPIESIISNNKPVTNINTPIESKSSVMAEKQVIQDTLVLSPNKAHTEEQIEKPIQDIPYIEKSSVMEEKQQNNNDYNNNEEMTTEEKFIKKLNEIKKQMKKEYRTELTYVEVADLSRCLDFSKIKNYNIINTAIKDVNVLIDYTRCRVLTNQYNAFNGNIVDLTKLLSKDPNEQGMKYMMDKAIAVFKNQTEYNYSGIYNTDWLIKEYDNKFTNKAA